MTISYSSGVELARANGVLGLFPNAQLQIYDTGGNPLATILLSSNPGLVFNNVLILNGIPTAVTVSSAALVGATPFSAAILSSGGQMMISGIPVSMVESGIIITSSAVNPGVSLGVLTFALVNP